MPANTFSIHLRHDSRVRSPISSTTFCMSHSKVEGDNGNIGTYRETTRENIRNLALITIRLGFVSNILSSQQATALVTGDAPLKGYQTKSGLKYFDLEEGNGIQPRYGSFSLLVVYHHYYCTPTVHAHSNY